MTKHTPHSSKQFLAVELAKRFSPRGRRRERFTYWRKCLLWTCVIGSARFAKRGLDILVSFIALVVLAPVFVGVAIAIKIEDSKGGVFFVQNRVGRWGREFPFPKFRSMVANAQNLKDTLMSENQHGESITFKMKDDPRITKVGRILRRTSLDELPQLWSVLKGDMTLVGPRPPVMREVQQYTMKDRRRLDVTPGITCIWQVSGRAEIPFEQQVELDASYIQSQSIYLDIVLLLKTIPAVLLGKGSY